MVIGKINNKQFNSKKNNIETQPPIVLNRPSCEVPSENKNHNSLFEARKPQGKNVSKKIKEIQNIFSSNTTQPISSNTTQPISSNTTQPISSNTTQTKKKITVVFEEDLDFPGSTQESKKNSS